MRSSMQGRAAEAEASCRQALTLEPGYPEGHNNLGNALKDQGRLEEAEVCYPAGARPQAGFGRGAQQSRPGIEGSGQARRRAGLLSAGRLRSARPTPMHSAISAICCSTSARSSPHWTRRNWRWAPRRSRTPRLCSCGASAIPPRPRRSPMSARFAATCCALCWSLGVARASSLHSSPACSSRTRPIGGCIRRANEAWPNRPSEAELLGARRLADDRRRPIADRPARIDAGLRYRAGAVS